MDESFNEVVLIDDNSDIEMSCVEVPPQPSDVSNQVTPCSRNDEDFRVRLKRFLESYCNVVDLINLDSDSEDEKKMNSKCMNSYCLSGEDIQVAPDFVKSHYGLLKSKNQQVCRQCYDASVTHFKELAKKIEEKEPVFLMNFPKCSQVVMIDSDDEKEVMNKDEPITAGDIEVLTKDFDSCLNSFFRNHNLNFQEKHADELLSNKVTELENSFVTMKEELLSTEKDLMGCMSTLYDAYIPKGKEVEVLEIPFEEMRPFHLKSIDLVDDTFSSTENDIIMIHEASATTNTKPLPPIGDLVRTKPKTGDRVYVMKVSTFSEWVPAKIEEVIQKSAEGGRAWETYRVKIESGRQSSYQKEVIAGYMAYWDPPTCRLPLGTRIISLSTASHRMPKKFFSGITAEYLSNSNLQRYLVFYDDGYAQYAHHDDVRVVCESKTDVSEYFKPGSHEFIRHYLDNFPERPMLKVRLMDTIKTEYGGHWYNARVKSIDCALVQMLFLKDFRTEWIYRGSTRLFPLYAELKMKKETRHRNMGPRKNRPIIHYSDGIETCDDGVCSEGVIEISQPRAVARKSSAKPTLSATWDTRKNYVKPLLTPDYGVIEVLIPDGPKPKSYVKHNCNPKCVAWVRNIPEKSKTRNPLSIPHIHGFRRFQLVGDSEQDIVYKAPCGRVLKEQDEILEYLRITKCELTVELFDFNFWVNIFDEFVIPERFIKIKDLSYGREDVPIQCVNTFDNAVPTYMDYITERRGCEGVFLNLDSGFLTCCDCTDNCEDKMKCACWQKTINGFKALGKKNNTDPNSIGYQYRRLPDLVSTGIYECNHKCKCKKTCLNRVVQHPLRLNLQLFKTKKKGWGTRCLNDIPCGTFICVYVGDILTEANANEGGKRYGDEYFAELDYIEVVEALKEDYENEVVGGHDLEDEIDDEVETEKRNLYFESDEEFEPNFAGHRTSQSGSSLGMQLRQRKSNRKENARGEEFFSDQSEDSLPDSRQPRVPRNFDANIVDNILKNDRPSYPSVRSYFAKDEAVYIMDAKTAGNIGRYLNHSCDPNIFVQNVFVDTHDLRFPWVAFFALRYIKAGTELTWDYRYEVGSVPGKKMYCHCGAHDCRGRLL